MRKSWLAIIFVFIFALTGCDLFSGGKDDVTKYDDELDSSTGKWFLIDEEKNVTDTYFEFDGAKDVMTFKYVEKGDTKYSGTYRVVYQENNGENTYTLNFILSRNDVEKEDWLYTYVDDFKTDFTQFTTIKEEKSKGMNDGRIYSHIYRISELPYKLGTYVLEGKEYKQEKDNYKYANTYQVPEGTYSLNDGVSMTFVMPKPYAYALFQYKNEDEIVEGVYWTSSDKNTIYLYIEHNPYEYIRKEDRENYDMTFSHDYPPDFYLRGNFDASNGSIVINGLYHHDYSPTTIKNEVFAFGTYTK
ncbi:hypothetical protein IJ556_06475 [bacterium]|nr:hypothetical protein [bacterium]MBR1748031.1 hypothetical protein [Clostridia bacterium]